MDDLYILCDYFLNIFGLESCEEGNSYGACYSSVVSGIQDLIIDVCNICSI